jgi:hypothetical protein
VTAVKIPVFWNTVLYHWASISLTSPPLVHTAFFFKFKQYLFLGCRTLKIKALQPFKTSQTTTPAIPYYFTEDLTTLAKYVTVVK